MATTLLGAIVVPMNSWWSGSELEYGLKDSGSKLIFVDPARLAQISPFLDRFEVDVVLIKPQAESTQAEFYSLIEATEPLTIPQANGTVPGT